MNPLIVAVAKILTTLLRLVFVVREWPLRVATKRGTSVLAQKPQVSRHTYAMIVQVLSVYKHDTAEVR